jgi:hypothetical protein
MRSASRHLIRFAQACLGALRDIPVEEVVDGERMRLFRKRSGLDSARVRGRRFAGALPSIGWDSRCVVIPFGNLDSRGAKDGFLLILGEHCASPPSSTVAFHQYARAARARNIIQTA